jgi:hypothetical protein
MLNSGKKIRALRDKKVNILTLVKWSVPYNKQKNKDYRETRAGLVCFMVIKPISTICQLNRGGQFYWWKGPGENHRPVVSH